MPARDLVVIVAERANAAFTRMTNQWLGINECFRLEARNASPLSL